MKMKKLMTAFLCIALALVTVGCTVGGLHDVDKSTPYETVEPSVLVSDETSSNETITSSETPSNEIIIPSETPSSEVGNPSQTDFNLANPTPSALVSGFNIRSVPQFSGTPYYVVNNNVPYFKSDECTTNSYEHYSELDSLGRCGVAIASLGRDLMPTEDREPIGSIKPSGWHTVKYDCVDGKYLYNRCHLIGFQLSGENANDKNLITGTRYMNVNGMLPFENMVADYIKETNNHVMYRVTPVFEGNNLVATGVLMEAYSVEDDGDGICFNVFCYNSQPGIVIEYLTGESWLNSDSNPTTPKPTPKPTQSVQETEPAGRTYVLNTNTKKFHYPSCRHVASISPNNRWDFFGNREEIIEMGYTPCGTCHP